ncbi:unnamed protein product [Acanthoscelides obtectus]|uniref:Uncharacterized protein n=1 Tax=Acanthoscelides obtectus TaxID=200917 RepID=A0A9P0K6S4_ACAOB|nr:unnamed protein product [Acanthoscelides obtectus]CAK1671965.1 hypothetical protein AOBTE_LOCUS28573 [Acanthoscelides obtectus]
MKDIYTPHGVTDTMANEAKSNDDDRDNDASIIPESPENADTVDTQTHRHRQLKLTENKMWLLITEHS